MPMMVTPTVSTMSSTWAWKANNVDRAPCERVGLSKVDSKDDARRAKSASGRGDPDPTRQAVRRAGHAHRPLIPFPGPSLPVQP